MRGVHLQHRLGHRGHVGRDAARVAAIADPRARLAHERAAAFHETQPEVPVGGERRRAREPAGLHERVAADEHARGGDRVRLVEHRRELGRAHAGRREARAAARRWDGRPPPTAVARPKHSTASGCRPIASSWAASLPGSQASSASSSAIQSHPSSCCEPRLPRRSGPLAALVAHHGVLVRRRIPFERRLERLVEEGRGRPHRQDQTNPHSGSVSG